MGKRKRYLLDNIGRRSSTSLVLVIAANIRPKISRTPSSTVMFHIFVFDSFVADFKTLILVTGSTIVNH